MCLMVTMAEHSMLRVLPVSVGEVRWEGVHLQEITILPDVNGGLGLSVNDLFEVGLFFGLSLSDDGV